MNTKTQDFKCQPCSRERERGFQWFLSRMEAPAYPQLYKVALFSHRLNRIKKVDTTSTRSCGQAENVSSQSSTELAKGTGGANCRCRDNTGWISKGWDWDHRHYWNIYIDKSSQRDGSWTESKCIEFGCVTQTGPTTTSSKSAEATSGRNHEH